MHCPTTVKAVRELSERYPGSLAKLIDDKANGTAVIQMLQHHILRQPVFYLTEEEYECYSRISPI